MQLYNKYDRHLLEQQLLNEGIDRITISFYKYTRFEDPNAFRDELYLNLDKLKVFGRIYVAQEGINAQISVPKHAFYDLKDYLYSIPGLDGIRLNIAADDDGKSFIKLKILVRHKIVADGLDDSTFNPSDVGHYLKARDFNRLIESPDTLVIDMRNHYESEVGRFKNAITPDVDTFRDSLPIIRDMLKGNEHKNVVMYCTGGIRCEKASAYFKHVGFDNVYHLEGGIINYFHQVKEENLDNKFIGKNFVFDRRLGERITDDIIAVCHQCGKPCDNHTNCVNEGCHILFIQCDECKSKFNNCCSDECKDIIALPLEKQKELRKGKPARNVFKKGRSPKLIYKK